METVSLAKIGSAIPDDVQQPAALVQVVLKVWHNFPDGFSHRPEAAASTVNITTSRCKPTPPSCISPAAWHLSLRLTLRSIGAARGKCLLLRMTV